MNAPDPSRPATLRDVAKLAGVHPSTASRALSGARTVNPDLARAVRKAARTLDYRVNSVGRALRQQTTGTIGMVVPDIENPFFPALVQAVERTLHVHEYGLFLCDAGNRPDVEAARLRALVERRVDGILISPAHRERSMDAVQAVAQRVPVVQVDRSVEAPIDAVGADQSEVMAAVIDHLRELGRARFAFIASDASISTVADRLTAYRARFADTPDALERIYIGELSLRWGHEAAERILSEGTPVPDALVCANDLIALGAMQRLRTAGVAVPAEIAVTGVDDTPFARVAEPALTTVRQPVDQMAEEAVALLFARREQPRRVPRRLVLAPELVVRRSTVIDAEVGGLT